MCNNRGLFFGTLLYLEHASTIGSAGKIEILVATKVDQCALGSRPIPIDKAGESERLQVASSERMDRFKTNSATV